jgi:nicotinamide riboside kinase
MIRIAVTGAHSVGKSTLIEALRSALQGRGISVSCSPEPIETLGPEIRTLDLRGAYMRLIEEHFHRLGEPVADCCLYDRSFLDMLVYFRCSRDEDALLERLMIELLQWHRHFIDLYIYLPIEIPLVPNSRRPPSESLRQRIDNDIRTTLASLDSPQLEVTGSVEQRTEQALEHIVPLLAR